MYLIPFCYFLFISVTICRGGFWDDVGDAARDVRDAAKNGDLCWNNCAWTEWGRWGSCTRSCGGGTRRRRRGLCGLAWLTMKEKLKKCDKDAEDREDTELCGESCFHGSTWSSYTESCHCQPYYTGTCCDKMQTHWSEWGAWGRCSQSCSPSKVHVSRQRTRTCIKARSTHRCRGSTVHTQQCSGLPTCPVNHWSEWLQWSDCTTSCNSLNNTGTRSRSRICIKVSDNNSCEGRPSEVEKCRQLPVCEETTTTTTTSTTSTTTAMPVMFASIPQNVSVELEGTVLFECATYPELPVFWYHNGFPVIENDHSGWYQVLPGGVMIISAVNTYHTGEYMCEVYTDSGIMQTLAWLTIPEAEETCQIEMVSTPHNVTVAKGSFTTLQCHTESGAPVFWYKIVEPEDSNKSKSEDRHYDNYLTRFNDNLKQLGQEEVNITSGFQNDTDDYYINEYQNYMSDNGRDMSYEGSYRVYLGGTGVPPEDIDVAKTRAITENRELVQGVNVLRNGYLMLHPVMSSHSGTYTCEVKQDNCTVSYNTTVTVYNNISEVCGSQIHNKSNWFNPMQTGHIVGGNEAPIGSVPWQVLMEESRVGFICGGVLLTPQWILTAAHCFSSFRRRYQRQLNNRNLLLKFGKHDRIYEDPFEQEKHMSHKFIHPLFHPKTFNNDIALIKLTSAVELTDYVRPVCLPDMTNSQYKENIKPGKYGMVTGWGRTSEGGLSAETLREIQLQIQDQQTCINSTFERVTSRMFCAGDTQGNKDACKGDSGGPFVVPIKDSQDNPRWHLTGIVSWGKGCGRHGNFGFYTNVTETLKWIYSKIAD